MNRGTHTSTNSRMMAMLKRLLMWSLVMFPTSAFAEDWGTMVWGSSSWGSSEPIAAPVPAMGETGLLLLGLCLMLFGWAQADVSEEAT